MNFPTFVNFIPADRNFVPTERAAALALEQLKELFPYSVRCEILQFETPRYISPECLASEATCPNCGHSVSRSEKMGTAARKWFARMDEEWFDAPMEGQYTAFPVCGHEVPVTALKFNAETGMARFALRASFTYCEEFASPEQCGQLGATLGTPVISVMAVCMVTREARKLIERLASADDDIRLEVIPELEKYPFDFFNDSPVNTYYLEDMCERLLVAFHNTRHAAVKEWALSMACYAGAICDDLTAIVESVLRARADTALLRNVLTAIALQPKHYQYLHVEVKALFNHHDALIRTRCARFLARFPLTYEDDFDAVSALLLDHRLATRRCAFKVLTEKLIGQRPPSRTECELLEKMLATELVWEHSPDENRELWQIEQDQAEGLKKETLQFLAKAAT